MTRRRRFFEAFRLSSPERGPLVPELSKKFAPTGS